MIEVIINSGSGNDAEKHEIVHNVGQWMSECGCLANVNLASNSDELMQHIERAINSNAQIIVGGGGDGTLNTVASAALRAGKTFGVLPLGTLNHFAKDLGVPLDLHEAVKTICEGHTTTVDVAELNGRIFLNNSSLGLYPDLVYQRESLQIKLGYSKWRAFVQALLVTWQRYKLLNVTIEANLKKLKRRTAFVFVGNNEYIIEAGQEMGGRNSLKSGQLSLFVSHGLSRWEMVKVLLRAMFGVIPERQTDLQLLCLDEVTIRTRQKYARVSFDGEVEVIQTPLHYRIRPAALKVCVPAKASEQSFTESHADNYSLV